MAYTAILYDKIGRVARITLNRPEKMNSLSTELSRDIVDAIKEANADDDVRAIVLTGAGRAFCAGANLEASAGTDEAATARRNRGLLEWYLGSEGGSESTRVFHRSTKPIIGAINGYALGAGFELAIKCDILIASENAVMGAPEIRHGSIVATWLPFIIGPMWSKRIILTGDHITAHTAQRIGLVVDVVPHEQLMEKAMGLADRIAMVPPLAVRLNKRMLDGVVEMMGYEQAMEYGEMVAVICHSLGNLAETPDGRNLAEIRGQFGVRAFLEARDGPFGRFQPW
jgi:enoyl-CoA hydratase/carnithine racemase